MKNPDSHETTQLVFKHLNNIHVMIMTMLSERQHWYRE